MNCSFCLPFFSNNNTGNYLEKPQEFSDQSKKKEDVCIPSISQRHKK